MKTYLKSMSFLMTAFTIISCFNDGGDDKKVEPETITYSVTYDGNGHTGGSVPVDSKKYEEGEQVTVRSNTGYLVKTNYIFNGWNTSSNGTGIDRNPDTKFPIGTANVTLYAKWELDTYTVTFDTDGGSSITSQSITHGFYVIEPTDPNKTYFVFDGWYKESSCTNEWNFSADTVTDNVTIHAKWVNTYELRDTGPAGGLIFYINIDYLTDGWRYLEAAPNDQDDGGNFTPQWGCMSTLIDQGLNRWYIGSGEQNTIDIEAECTTSGIAADICANLSLGVNTDWFLPSKYELDEMYNNLKVFNVGSFSDAIYWSSTELLEDDAYGVDFSDGSEMQALKSNSYRVRAARMF